MIKKIIPLLVLLGMAAPSMAQLVECNWLDYCNNYDGCYYKCSDGYFRYGSTRFFKYSCEKVNDLYNEKPNCNAIYEKIRQENNERRKRQDENHEAYAREEGKRCDLGQAFQMSVCLEVIGQLYIDKVNDFLVNGQNTPLIDKIDFNSVRDSINSFGSCSDIFSYKDIASAVGNSKAYRAVGMANRNNSIPLFIPCHRVIKSDGSLGGFSGKIDKKQKLIALEKGNFCS